MKSENEWIFSQREQRAIDFAKSKHKDQKYDNGSSYFDGHLQKTVDILKQVTDDIDIIIAGYLHDTIEDTDTTFTDIKNMFNPRIAGLVFEITKVDGGFPNLKSQDAIIIKFADRLANISDMNAWSRNRQQSYLYKSRFW